MKYMLASVNDFKYLHFKIPFPVIKSLLSKRDCNRKIESYRKHKEGSSMAVNENWRQEEPSLDEVLEKYPDV